MIFIGIIVLGILVTLFFMYREKRKVESYSRYIDRAQLRLDNAEDKAFEWVTNNKRAMPVVSAIARSMYKANSSSYEATMRIAVLSLLGLVASWVIAAIGIMFIDGLWYLKLVYFVAVVSAIVLLFMNVLTSMSNKFEDQIPELSKKLNQAYGKNYDLMYALRTVSEEVPENVGKLVDRLIDAFEKTNIQTVADDLEGIKHDFDSDNVVTLVTLLHLTKVNGGGKTVEDQLDQITTEIYNDRDNERDIFSVVKPFIMGGLLIPILGLWAIEYYSLSAAKDVLGDYFTSPRSYLYKILTMVGMTAFLWLMQFYQSRKVV